MVEIQALDERYQGWAADFLAEQWGSVRMVSRGRLVDLTSLPGFVVLEDGRPAALLTYEIVDGSCEVTSLNSNSEGGGAGSALIEAVRERAVQAGCWRLWVITTNDNMQALRFYQKRSFVMTAVYADALKESRRLKPRDLTDSVR